MVRIPGFHCHGPGSVPGWGTGDPASYVAQPKKKRTYPQNFPSAAASSPTSGPGARTVLLSCCLAPHCCFQSWLSQFTGLWKFMDVHGVHGTTLSSSSTLFSSFRAGSATLSEPASPFERITLPTPSPSPGSSADLTQGGSDSSYIAPAHFDTAPLTDSEMPLANHSCLSTVTLLSCHHPLLLNLGTDSVLLI